MKIVGECKVNLHLPHAAEIWERNAGKIVLESAEIWKVQGELALTHPCWNFSQIMNQKSSQKTEI